MTIWGSTTICKSRKPIEVTLYLFVTFRCRILTTKFWRSHFILGIKFESSYHISFSTSLFCSSIPTIHVRKLYHTKGHRSVGIKLFFLHLHMKISCMAIFQKSFSKKVRNNFQSKARATERSLNVWNKAFSKKYNVSEKNWLIQKDFFIYTW